MRILFITLYHLSVLFFLKSMTACSHHPPIETNHLKVVSENKNFKVFWAPSLHKLDRKIQIEVFYKQEVLYKNTVLLERIEVQTYAEDEDEMELVIQKSGSEIANGLGYKCFSSTDKSLSSYCDLDNPFQASSFSFHFRYKEAGLKLDIVDLSISLENSEPIIKKITDDSYVKFTIVDFNN